jgi:hypothetical protein
MLKTITSTANTVGSLEYKGLWNAATNTPTLVSSVGTQGDYYVVSVAGTTNLDGVTTWDEGDWAIFNGSVWQLFQGGQDGVFATLTVSGEIAANGGIALGDNDKATFGGSDDLQIYHDGTASYISDTGTGTLNITASGSIRLRGNDTDEFLARFNENGSNQFYYDNSEKLSTTATGIDITGTATMDGLTVSSSGAQANLLSTNASEHYIYMKNTEGSAYIGQDAGVLQFWSGGNTGGVGAEVALKIDGNNDISFFEDTGTTPKLFWDASAEYLSVGSTTGTFAPINYIGSNGRLGINNGNTAGGTKIQSFAATNANGYLAFEGWDKEYMRITSAGLLGLGTSSPSQDIEILNGTTGAGIRLAATGTAYWDIERSASTGNLTFTDDAAGTVLTLDQTSGNVGIGTSSPQELLHLAATAPVFRLEGASRTYQQYVSGTNFFIRDVTAGLNRVTLDASGNVAIGTTTVNSKFNVASSQDALKYNEGVTVFRSTGSNKMFLNCVGGGANIVGSNSPITFNYHDQTTNNVTEAMRIVSGNLLVGKTASDLGVTAGIELNGQYDVGYFTRSGDKALVVNRLSSDGSITDFRKDGTSVGFISSLAGTQLIIDSAGDRSGIRLEDNALLPRKNSAMADGTVSLGSATYRFKDLLLSGGVVFGTTGGSVSSKTLDDYEEGTWTPVLADAATAGNTATMTADGRYTKIGRLITVECRMLDIDTTGMTAGNNIFIRGLPEVVSANSRAIGSVSLDRVNFTNYVVVVGGANTSYALLSDQIDSDQDVVLTVAAITSTGSDITFTLQYTI